MAYGIFISHAGEDNFVAEKLREDAADLGAEPFLDRLKIQRGQGIDDEILKNLETTDELWALFTPSSLFRPYVWLEVGVAWCRRIHITPVLFALTEEELRREDRIPSVVKNLGMVDLNDTAAYKRFLAEVGDRIRRKVSRPTKPWGLGGSADGQPPVNALAPQRPHLQRRLETQPVEVPLPSPMSSACITSGPTSQFMSARRLWR
jgi:hypothetical protein